jgi:short subunit dehydrogenase-like uncharacterized protein
MRLRVVQAGLQAAIRVGPPGPTAAMQARSRTVVWGEAVDGAGGRAVARLHGPEAYAWTTLTALAVVERILAGNAPPGFQTPAGAYGQDLALATGDVRREDL